MGETPVERVAFSRLARGKLLPLRQPNPPGTAQCLAEIAYVLGVSPSDLRYEPDVWWPTGMLHWRVDSGLSDRDLSQIQWTPVYLHEDVVAVLFRRNVDAR